VRVEWLGGPDDGGLIDIPDQGRWISVAILEGESFFAVANNPSDDVRMVEYRVPVRLYSNGWKAVWKDKVRHG
jgi:hypothetical protein